MKLEDCRRESGQLKDISFDTISAAGPNGAIVHYRPTHAEQARRSSPARSISSTPARNIVDGTTDVTRTLAIGTPTAEMRRHYGLVLKAHIAIATARFPKGTRGQDLDPFARRPLWEAGLDFDHGTGHGVGSYLSVHEGPQRLSRLGTRRARARHDPVQRAGLLSRRPIRHQARKSRAGDAAASRSRAARGR